MTGKTTIRMRSGSIYNVEQTVEEIDGRLTDVEIPDQGFLHVSGYRMVQWVGSEPEVRSLYLKINLIETIEER